jgi:hypothetical protein
VQTPLPSADVSALHAAVCDLPPCRCLRSPSTLPTSGAWR